MYVEELIGPETVNTMPLETIQAFQDHGVVADTLEQGLDEARQVFDELGRAGVDYDDVTDTLEREGVQKFSDSFAELLDGIRAKQRELVSAYWRSARRARRPDLEPGPERLDRAGDEAQWLG